MLSPVYQGLTCQPTTNSSASCTLGGYPAYAVNVSTVGHIQLAVNFIRHTGVRLVVKNTGHDFSGKSGGAGALSVWTHHLKDVKYISEYDAPGTDWHGAAFKLGAGVQAFEIYKAAADRGLMIVGGEGQTVGVAGGYIIGGGHSPLSSMYGLAADQVLSMQVVLPDGQFVTASFTDNQELFWALRGGGGSTFGIVTSVTVKAYPTVLVTASTFSWSTGANLTRDNFWAGFRAYMELLVEYSDQGLYSYFFIMLSDGELTFLMQPFFGTEQNAGRDAGPPGSLVPTAAAAGNRIHARHAVLREFLLCVERFFPSRNRGEDERCHRLTPLPTRKLGKCHAVRRDL